MNAYGRATVQCPAISTGTEDINIAISVAQTQVANATGRARMTWNNGFSNLNQSQHVDTVGQPVGAGADAVIRVWIEVITGTLSLTPAPSTYQNLWAEYQPAED
jgi:hypothetical protein